VTTSSEKIVELSEELRVLENLVVSAAGHLGGDLDEEQIELYDLALSQAEISGARSLLGRCINESASETSVLAQAACYFAAETFANTLHRLQLRTASFGINSADLPTAEIAAEYLAPKSIAALGRSLLEEGLPLDQISQEQAMIRDTFHEFSNEVVRPLAEEIHRKDLIIPETILQPLKAMGCFGLSVPQRFGGLKPDDHEDSLGMVIVTEELSRGSLGAAGSLITRPEIMARAILEGGTEGQKARWLPGIAAGEPLCAISVTEPNTGSDVASVRLRATPTEGGWLLNGGKTWCTFAGKAELILVLARTDPDLTKAHRGLSLFVVNKPSTDGHEFEHIQPAGGKISGRSIPTLGYRGMHSFEMFYDDYFVADEDLIGESAGVGKGFYFTMRGFMGGRLQTAARAAGLMRAAFESASRYAQDRQVFGRSIASYPLSLSKIARMGSHILAAKAFTADVARLMDAGSGALEASLVKLLACRSAEWVTREAVQLYGGMGYAEETDVSRYFADARVLSIFEGAEETLAIRVVGKALIEQTRNQPSLSQT
jgi:(2S)-methylsuccinyl-CoA dehydrogenase